MGKFVAYLRVSTNKQGHSGLGLEAQQHAVAQYVVGIGGELTGSFTEIESGTNGERPQMKLAIQYCRSARATLVVAKLDRLARNVSFISQLMDSGVEFVAADMPQANRLTVHLIAAVAEYESHLISVRTKAALKAHKERGGILGNPDVRAQQSRAVAAAQQKADNFARKMAPLVKAYDPESKLSARRLAEVLMAEGISSPRGKKWTAASVINLRKRIASLT